LESVFHDLQWDKKGIKIDNLRLGNDNEQFLNNLRFADDIVIFAKRREELEIMAEDLRRESAKVGLSINFSTTKIMTNIDNFGNIKLINKDIESFRV